MKQKRNLYLKLNADAIRKWCPDLADNFLSHNFVRNDCPALTSDKTIDVVCKVCGDSASIGTLNNLDYESKEEVLRDWGTLLSCNDTIVKDILE